MLLCVCLVIDHRWCQNVVTQKSDTQGSGECVADVLTHIDIFCDVLLLWNSEQTLSNMEFICFI